MNKELSSESFRDDHYLGDELNSLVGQHIVSVKYILVNGEDYEFNEFHSVDKSILIEFSNGKFLFWNWEEVDFDPEDKRYLPDRYELKLPDHLPHMESYYKLKVLDVSDTSKWRVLMSSAVQSIEIFTQEYQYTSGYKIEKIVTEFIVRTDCEVFGVYGVDEPDSKIKGSLHKPSFEINNLWTLVVFDQKMIDEITPIRNG
ncbi:MAG: hypothetical protein R2809_14265 [Flavobacteriales bacterium]